MKDSIPVEYNLLEELFSQKTAQLPVPDKDDSKVLRRQSATMEVGDFVVVVVVVVCTKLQTVSLMSVRARKFNREPRDTVTLANQVAVFRLQGHFFHGVYIIQPFPVKVIFWSLDYTMYTGFNWLFFFAHVSTIC